MNKYKEYIEERFLIIIEDGIIFFTFKKEHIDYNFVNDAIKMRIEFSSPKVYPMLSDLRKVKSSTREARERMAAKDGGIGVNAVAILINSKIQKTIYNFFNTIYKAPAPTKLFTDKEKAIKWLEQYKQ